MLYFCINFVLLVCVKLVVFKATFPKSGSTQRRTIIYMLGRTGFVVLSSSNLLVQIVLTVWKLVLFVTCNDCNNTFLWVL